MDSEAQMQLLFAELKRIEGQQQQLKSAVAQNRVLVVHPPKGFHAESAEDEYAEEKEVIPDPDRFIPSGVNASRSSGQTALKSQGLPCMSLAHTIMIVLS